MRPSEEEALRLHRKYGSSEVMVKHCRAVAKVASILTEELERQGRGRIQMLPWPGLGSMTSEGTGPRRSAMDSKALKSSVGREWTRSWSRLYERHVGAGKPTAEARKLGS